MEVVVGDVCVQEGYGAGFESLLVVCPLSLFGEADAEDVDIPIVCHFR